MNTILMKRSGLVRVALMATFAASLAVPAFASNPCCVAADGHSYCLQGQQCPNGWVLHAGCYCTNYVNGGSGVSYYTGCGASGVCTPYLWVS
jgi:hypothetical protein